MNLQKFDPWVWSVQAKAGSESQGQVAAQGNQAGGHLAQNARQGQNPIFSLQREIDRVFDDMFNRFSLPQPRFGAETDNWLEWGGESIFRPSVDIAADDKAYQVALDVPGVKEDDLSIEVQGDTLVVKGKKEERREEGGEDKQYYRLERSYGSFQRALALPDDANLDQIKASLNNGVLRLDIPKRENAEPAVKKISITH